MKVVQLILASAGLSASAFATTKGLNQIVTPDIQSLGQLSVSFQAQNQAIGNPLQIQYEIGLTKSFEIAAFQGLKPGEFYFAAEYGIVQGKEFQLSTGVLNYAAQGSPMQPFLEAGYTKGAGRAIVGIQRIGRANDLILGGNYSLNNKLMLAADYIGGEENFATIGATYTATNAFSVNPAIYVSNTSGHKIYPYFVATWNVQVFK